MLNLMKYCPEKREVFQLRAKIIVFELLIKIVLRFTLEKLEKLSGLVYHTVRKLKESYKGMLKVELITTQKRAYYRVDLKKKRFFLQTVFLAK